MIETHGRLARLSAGTALAVASLCMTPFAHAQASKVTAVINEQASTEQAAKQSQARITQLDEEASSMLIEYRQTISEARTLKAYVEQFGAQVKSQQDEIAVKATAIADAETTSREVMPMMVKMLATLEQFVALDVPFLLDERNKRVEELKSIMARADVTVSEKYRRIVEAYQIEMEYGRTLDVTEGTIGDRTVKFLRVGRIALMYSSLDGKEVGYWDVKSRQWIADNSYADAVASGIKVASKQSAPDFVRVPVYAPSEVK